MTEPVYSVVVPVFNSSLSLKELYAGLQAVFGKTGKDFEVIFVDDASSDNSWEVLSGIKSNDPGHVTAIALSRNFGQHNATLCGMSYAKGDFIVTIDDDLQVLPEEIIRLMERQAEPGQNWFTASSVKNVTLPCAISAALP